jgi:hypothetical protein
MVWEGTSLIRNFETHRQHILGCFDSLLKRSQGFKTHSNSPGKVFIYLAPHESFEKVEKFKYLGTTLTNQYDIRDEIKSRLNSGNACYYSVQNLSSRLI